MIHGYHVVCGAYGFCLPNDPRGSWSDFVASWELLRFGKATYGLERREVDLQRWQAWRAAAVTALKFPAVALAGQQARAVGNGFGTCVRKSRLTIWACSILPEHVHLVVARHRYKVEQVCNLLKGEATKRLKAESCHPQSGLKTENGRLPSMWAEGQWKVYLETEEEIESAVRYVEENPIKEGKPSQRWSFVTVFSGLDKSGWPTYY